MKIQRNWNLVYYLISRLGLKEDSPAAMAIIVGGVLLCMLVPYLLGSFNFGLIISRNKFHDDIRNHGSGNAGTTNMLRTYGKKAAVLTLLGDMCKAALAVGFGYLMFNRTASYTDLATGVVKVVDDPTGAAIAGLFVMMGHMFPIFYKFKGGKGVATAAMVVLLLSWPSFLICFLIFAIIVVGTRFVSLASCMGMIFYPIILSAFSRVRPEEVVSKDPSAQIAAVVMATLVVFMHRENLKRLSQGKESKLYFSKKKREEAEAAAAAKEAAGESERRPDPVLLDRNALGNNRRRRK